MTSNRNPLATIHRAARLGLDLLKIGEIAKEKACYFFTAQDNFAMFNYYTALGDLCQYVYRYGPPNGLTFPDGSTVKPVWGYYIP